MEANEGNEIALFQVKWLFRELSMLLKAWEVFLKGEVMGNKYNGNQSYSNKDNQKSGGWGRSHAASYKASSVRDSSKTIQGPSSERPNASIDRARAVPE